MTEQSINGRRTPISDMNVNKDDKADSRFQKIVTDNNSAMTLGGLNSFVSN